MKTDQEINALVAEKVAGWKRRTYDGNKRDALISPAGYFNEVLPDYLNSADAVLPLLEKLKAEGFWVEIKDHTDGIDGGLRDWLVVISNYPPSDDPVGGDLIYAYAASPTFARAAVFTLLKAKGIEVHRED